MDLIFKNHNSNYYWWSIYYLLSPVLNVLYISMSFKHQTTVWARHFYLILQKKEKKVSGKIKWQLLYVRARIEHQFYLTRKCVWAILVKKKKKSVKVIMKWLIIEFLLWDTIGFAFSPKTRCVTLGKFLYKFVSSLTNENKNGTHLLEKILSCTLAGKG